MGRGALRNRGRWGGAGFRRVPREAQGLLAGLGRWKVAARRAGLPAQEREPAVQIGRQKVAARAGCLPRARELTAAPSLR